MIDARLARRRSGVIITPRQHASAEALMTSVPRVNVKPLADNFRMLWSEPVQRNSVLSSLSVRWFADIKQLTSAIHSSNLLVAEAMLLQWRYSCVSSVKALRVTPCLAASSERSAVYKRKSKGPSTDPCETEHVTVFMIGVIPANTTQKVLPVRYVLNQANGSHWMPKPRLSVCNNRSWSTMSNAAVRSSGHAAEICPLSVAMSRSL